MLVDSHCHLDFPGLCEDVTDVRARAEAAGVGLMVTISTRIRQMDKILPIAEGHENIYCSVGTHPHNASEEAELGLDDILKFTDHPKVVAIGEAGLDYFYDNGDPVDQAKGFRAHIAAARQTGLPLVIHTRDAEEDTAKILKEETEKGAFPFLLHCFTASQELADVAISLGGYVSFSGVLTLKYLMRLERWLDSYLRIGFWLRLMRPIWHLCQNVGNQMSLPLWLIRRRFLVKRGGFLEKKLLR